MFLDHRYSFLVLVLLAGCSTGPAATIDLEVQGDFQSAGANGSYIEGVLLQYALVDSKGQATTFDPKRPGRSSLTGLVKGRYTMNAALRPCVQICSAGLDSPRDGCTSQAFDISKVKLVTVKWIEGSTCSISISQT